MSVALDKVVPVRSYRPELPPEIDDLIAHALEKDPEDRLPSIRAFATLLAPFAPAGYDTARWLGGEPPPSRRSLAEISRAETIDTATTLHASPPPDVTSKRRSMVLGALLGLAVLAGGVGVALSLGRGAAPTVGPTSETRTATPAGESPRPDQGLASTTGGAPRRPEVSQAFTSEPVASSSAATAPSASGATAPTRASSKPTASPRPAPTVVAPTTPNVLPPRL
jgi:serine/threonine-protein kinase